MSQEEDFSHISRCQITMIRLNGYNDMMLDNVIGNDEIKVNNVCIYNIIPLIYLSLR